MSPNFFFKFLTTFPALSAKFLQPLMLYVIRLICHWQTHSLWISRYCVVKYFDVTFSSEIFTSPYHNMAIATQQPDVPAYTGIYQMRCTAYKVAPEDGLI